MPCYVPCTCSFVSRDVALPVRAFIVYVRPSVEYNSVIWSPQNVHDIEQIEQVQEEDLQNDCQD